MTTKNPSNTPTQPAKWTWFELVGLIMAFGLIGWPVLNFTLGAVFPPNAQGQAASAFSITQTASVSNAAPGEQFNYIFAIKASRSTTLGRLTDVLPDQLNYVNSFCVPPNCDRVNNSEYNVDKRTLAYTGTSTAFQAGDSVTLVLVVQLSKTASGSVSNQAQVCDTSQVCISSSKVAVQVGGASPTPRPASTTAAIPTATSIPPSATAVPPTKTAVPPTNTAVPPTATAIPPTATSVPPTNTPSVPPTATPIAAPTPTPAKATATPASAGSNGEAGTPSSEQGTVSAATATAEPAGTLPPTTEASTPASTAGVIGGSFLSGSGASALSGNRVDLVLRGGGGEKVVASSQIDATGHYSFLDVPPTGSGEVYYVKFTNTTGGKTLSNWSTTSFAFSGGQANAPSADLSDVTVGQPGSDGTTFALPLTLNWSKRADGDSYSVTVFRADGTGVALASGNLGNATSYTLKSGTLPAGGYIADINVTSASGAGVTAGHFTFKVGAAAAAVTTSAAVAAPTTADPTSTPIPTATRVPVPPGDKGEVEVPATDVATVSAVQTTAATGTGTGTDTSTDTSVTPGVTTAATDTPSASVTAAATPAAVTTAATSTDVVTDSPDLAPIALVIGNGVLAFVNNFDTTGGVPAALPPGTSRLPQSGGELPLAGLLMAAGVLGWRRFRLVIRPKA